MKHRCSTGWSSTFLHQLCMPAAAAATSTYSLPLPPKTCPHPLTPPLPQERALSAAAAQEAARLAAQREASLVAEAERHVSQLQAQVAGLSRQLEDLASFQAAKYDLETELTTLRHESQQLKVQLVTQRVEMERWECMCVWGGAAGSSDVLVMMC